MRHITIFILFISTLSISAQEIDYQKHFNTTNGLAINGYDPVSYFKGEPLEGKTSLTYSYHGITYAFSGEENKAAFKANPSNYIPQYGGWCAYAIGESGDKVKINPKTYKIKDGKLYLFYNFRGTNTLELWNKDEVNLYNFAETNWSKIVKN